MIFVVVAAILLALLMGPVHRAWVKGGFVFIPYNLLGAEFHRMVGVCLLVAPLALLVFVVRLVTLPPVPVSQVIWLLFLGICIGRPIFVLSGGTSLYMFCRWAVPVLLLLGSLSLLETWLRDLKPHRFTWLCGASCVWGYWCIMAAILTIGP